jgi:regulator of sigma E protease
VTVSIDKEGKLGVGLGGLSIANLEKLGYYKVKTRIWFHGINSGRVTRGTDQLVGYGKQLKMIFSPSTGAYKQVGGFKAIFDIFPSGTGNISGPSRHYYP